MLQHPSEFFCELLRRFLLILLPLGDFVIEAFSPIEITLVLDVLDFLAFEVFPKFVELLDLLDVGLLAPKGHIVRQLAELTKFSELLSDLNEECCVGFLISTPLDQLGLDRVFHCSAVEEQALLAIVQNFVSLIDFFVSVSV